MTKYNKNAIISINVSLILILLVEKKITTIIKKERYKYGDVKNHVGQALAP